MTTAALANNQKQRLARNPHSLEAVESYCRAVEEACDGMPAPVSVYLAAVRTWMADRREQRILANTGLIGGIINSSISRLMSCNISRDDAHSEGMLGLIRAADLYDESSGNQFSTYATWWIRQCIQRQCRAASLIHIPSSVAERYQDDVKRARKVTRLSILYAHADGDSGESVVVDRRHQNHQDHSDTTRRLAELLRVLPQRERFILERYYLDGCNLREIGIEMGGLTRERVRQLRLRALERVRRFAVGER